MNELATKLQDKIDGCEAEIERIQKESARQIQESRDTKAVLVKAKLMLAANPEAEALLAQLRTLGLF